jgi:hypothetical protein
MLNFGEIDHEIDMEWSRYLYRVCSSLTFWEHFKLKLFTRLFGPVYRWSRRLFSVRGEYIVLYLLWLFVLGNHKEAKTIVETMFEIRREIVSEHFISDEEESEREEEEVACSHQ